MSYLKPVGFIILSLTLVLIAYLLSNQIPTLEDLNRDFQQGKTAEVAEALQGFLQEKADSVEGWTLLGKCLNRQKQYSDAADAFREAVRASRSDRKLQTFLAAALMNSARVDEAEHVYRALVETDSQDVKSRTELQWLLFSQLRLREVEMLLKQNLPTANDKFEILFHLAYSSQRPPNPRESIGKLEQIDSIRPGQATIRFAMGHCFWQLGQLDKAREILLSEQFETNRQFERELVIAEFLLELGDHEDAIRRLTPPSDQKAEWTRDDRWWWLQGKYYQQLGQLDLALDHISHASRLRPKESRYQASQIALMNALKRPQQATVLVDKLQNTRKAEQELYILVSRGDLTSPDSKTFLQLVEIYTELSEPEIAAEWRRLSKELEVTSTSP